MSNEDAVSLAKKLTAYTGTKVSPDDPTVGIALVLDEKIKEYQKQSNINHNNVINFLTKVVKSETPNDSSLKKNNLLIAFCGISALFSILNLGAIIYLINYLSF